MADLDKLAIRRDRGYLVRLILMLGVAILVSMFLLGWLTGDRTKGCVARFLGETSEKPEATPTPEPSR